jgi:CelD/BcsL family acetyltransferase involved in cellulose biosynthesis
LTSSITVSPENFESIASYCSQPDLNLSWNLVFTLPAWMRVWWQNFSSGSELYIRSVRENGRLIGLAPLRIKEDTISFIGSVNVCDYQDFIVSPGAETTFFKAILDYLKHQGINNLHLETIRPDSLVVKFLTPLAEEQGYKIDYNQTDVSSSIILPSEWNGYLEYLDAKQRHELKRKMRNLKDIGDTGYRTVMDKISILEETDKFLNLFPESRRDKAEFMTSEMKLFFRLMVESLSKQQIIGLGLLEQGKKPLAMVMYFDYGGNIYLYNSAYDPAYKDFSVGIISKALCIRESITNHKNEFDFLKGPEKYKAYLGGREIPLYSCDIKFK